MRRPSFTTSLALVLLAFAGCRDQASPVAPDSGNLLGFGTSTTLISCPNDTPVSTTALVEPLLGGILTVQGASITIPPGALSLPTVITLSVPASQYARVDVTALDIQHLLFNKPVTVTIDYNRCWRPELDTSPLTAWYLSPLLGTPIEKMPSTDDKSVHVVTFTTGHLSSYALAE